MATVTKAFSFTNSTVPYTAEGGSWAVTDGNKTTGSIVSGAESTNDPSGSAFGLQESITGKNSSNSGNFWEWTGTWENLGVPAGATVTNVQLTSDWRVPTYTTGAAGQVGPAEYRDSAGTLLGTFMAGSAFSSANATWATRTGSTLSVAAGQQASNTTIKLRLNNNLATGNSNSANVILQQDYIRVTVTYTGIPTPVSATIGAVIEAPQGLVMTQAVRIEAGQGLAVSEPSPIDTARVVAASATLSSLEANQKLASMKSHTLDALRQLLTTTGLATVESLSAIQMPSAVRSILDDFTGAAGPDLNFATEAEASRLIQRDGSGRATSVTDINHGFDGGEWPSLYGADQSVFVTVAAISGTGPGPALTLLARGQVLSAGTQSSYMARISQGASTAGWSIQNPPAGFILVGSTTPIQVGDTYELRCVGSEISFWRKRGGFWEPLGVTNNTSLIASGHVGLFLQSSTSSTISVDDFGVGAITTTPLLEVDILREVASTNVDPYESQSAANIITRTALLALEALQRRAVSGGFGGETDQEIVKSTSASADVSRSLAIPGSSEPMEGLKQLAVQATEGADAQQALLVPKTTSVESMLRISAVGSQDAIESVRPVGSTVTTVLDSLQGLAATLSSPYEAQQGGLIAVSQSAAFALESLRTLAAAGGEPIDALRRIAATSPYVAEAMRGIQAFLQDPANFISYSSVILADSPLHYWSLDETSGTTGTDLVAGSNGTYINTYTLNQAPAILTGKAVRFAGSGMLSVPYVSDFRMNGSFTYEFWLKPSSNTGSQFASVMGQGDWLFYRNTSSSTLVYRRPGSGTRFEGAVSPSGLALGTWYHVVLTYDSSSHTVVSYINGSVDHTYTSTTMFTSSNTGDLSIGHGDQSGDSTLDEVAFYNYPLTQAQVQEHYATAFGVPGPSLANVDGITNVAQALSLLSEALQPVAQTFEGD